MRRSSSVLAVCAAIVLTACGQPTTPPEALTQPAMDDPATMAPPGSPTSLPPVDADEPAAATPPLAYPEEPPDPDLVLPIEPWATGPDVAHIQARMLTLGLDPGPVDGIYGEMTRQAVMTLEGLLGVARDGVIEDAELAALHDGLPRAPLVPDGEPSRTEVDLARQVLTVYLEGEPSLTTHISTGNGEVFCDDGRCRRAVTPRGDFRLYRSVTGWRTSPLGVLYNPWYVYGGIAIHGSPSVPSYPASHGCIRLPMHISEYFPDLVWIGMPVHVR